MRDATHCDIVYEKNGYRCNVGGGSGMYYKIGFRNLVFYWSGREWKRSTKNVKDLKNFYKLGKN